jgi:hypothetical protein
MPLGTFPNDDNTGAYEQRLAALRVEARPRPDEYELFPIVILDGAREVLRVTFSKPSQAYFDRINETGFPLQREERQIYQQSYQVTWQGESRWLVDRFHKARPPMCGKELPSESIALEQWHQYLSESARESGFLIEPLSRRGWC